MRGKKKIKETISNWDTCQYSRCYTADSNSEPLGSTTVALHGEDIQKLCGSRRVDSCPVQENKQ